MVDHIQQNSASAGAAEFLILVVLRTVEAAPGSRPRVHGCSDGQVATALAVLSDLGFLEDYALTAKGRAFLQSLTEDIEDDVRLNVSLGLLPRIKDTVRGLTEQALQRG